ncbi:MAG: TonB-dependent receptor [candidate division Zixibacteria bacterium]|nr:TonB-dependent receptor [candidate division Zixibacteria bacterium]
MKRILGIFAIPLLVPFLTVSAQEQLSLAQNGAPHPPTGRITGKVVDGETGEPIIGARVFIEGSVPMIGAVTDLNGTYTLRNVPPGSHTLVAAYPEYAKLVVSGLALAGNETSQQDLSLKPEIKQVEGEVVEVVAKVSRGSAAGLLKDRQKAAAVSDAIGTEEMSRTGSGNAAQAMSKVTGTTIVDGKYVYVRGLGERYSTTQLNGAELPSTDPNKRAVHLDLFASNLIENIVTVKSYTPDKPGNFTGGSVNMVTKSYPDHFNASLSLSSAYNTPFSLQEGFLTSPGGHTDWLGMDDGTRAIPDPLQDKNVVIPILTTASRNSEQAAMLNYLSQSFNSHMAPARKMAPLNRNFAFSLGDQLQVLGRPLGFLGSLSYTRGFNSYAGGTVARYELPTSASQSDTLDPSFILNDSKSSDEVVWGALANFTYQPHPKHELKTNYMYNRSGESVARTLSGLFLQGGGLGESDVYESRVLQYTERSLGSFQLSGRHVLQSLLGVDLNWSGSLAKSAQDEPDIRYFSNHYSVVPDTEYTIKSNAYLTPRRYYRDLNEDNAEFNLDFSIPFKQWAGLGAKLKLGGQLLRKERTYRERGYEFLLDPNNTSLPDYGGDPEYFFSDEFVGLSHYDSTRRLYVFNSYVQALNTGRSNYDADQNISAVFGMLDFPILHKLRFAGGARLEITRMNVASKDTSLAKARLSNDDWLPSANLIYQLRPDMNLRTSYSRTLARPESRELADYSTFDFAGDVIYGGNPNLKRTLIHNYDLRWEYFERPSELYSIGGFYKRFIDPIERIKSGSHKETSSRNVPEANVYGLELEVRKRLDKMGSFLQHFQVGTNFTLVHSKVDVDSVELAIIRAFDPNPKLTRQLQGQSPYIFNLDLSYGNYKTGTTASLLYNVFGERLAEVNRGDAPNIFEQARGQLDFTLSQRIWNSVTFKGSVKNLLDSEYKRSYTLKGREYIQQLYKKGRTLSIGFNWAID